MNTETVSKSRCKTPVEILQEFYTSRKARNSGYSLNAFARDLGISKSLLSRIFSGSRPISMKVAMQISTFLGLNEAESRAMILSVIQNSPKSSKIARKIRVRLEHELNADSEIEAETIFFTTVEIERFKAMASWYHLAILNLTTIKGFKSDANWIACQLGISVLESRSAIERLISLGLLHEVEGVLKRSTQGVTVKTHRSEHAVRSFHEQMITKAKEELTKTDQQDFGRRLINGITFSCGRDQIELIKHKIEKFQDEILSLANSGEEKEELFQMNIQFFPLITNRGQENEITVDGNLIN